MCFNPIALVIILTFTLTRHQPHESCWVLQIQPQLFLIPYLVSVIITCSRIIICISHPRSRIIHFSKSCFLVRNGAQRTNLNVRVSYYQGNHFQIFAMGKARKYIFYVSFLFLRFFVLKIKRFMNPCWYFQFKFRITELQLLLFNFPNFISVPLKLKILIPNGINIILTYFTLKYR